MTTPPPPQKPPPEDPMAEAARAAAARARAGARDPEPSLGARLGQIGLLGWMVVVPMLAALAAGRWLDRKLATGIFFSAPALMLGAGVGFTLAWRWMHRRL